MMVRMPRPADAVFKSLHISSLWPGTSAYNLCQIQPSRVYLADEVAGTHRGMMIAIPEDEWAVFHGLTAAALGRILLDLASRVRLSAYRKQVRGPKRPQPRRESGAKIKHVSTAKLLGKRKWGI